MPSGEPGSGDDSGSKAHGDQDLHEQWEVVPKVIGGLHFLTLWFDCKFSLCWSQAAVMVRLQSRRRIDVVLTETVREFLLSASQGVSLSADIPRTGETMLHSLLDISRAGLVTGLSSAVEL